MHRRSVAVYTYSAKNKFGFTRFRIAMTASVLLVINIRILKSLNISKFNKGAQTTLKTEFQGRPFGEGAFTIIWAWGWRRTVRHCHAYPTPQMFVCGETKWDLSLPRVTYTLVPSLSNHGPIRFETMTSWPSWWCQASGKRKFWKKLTLKASCFL